MREEVSTTPTTRVDFAGPADKGRVQSNALLDFAERHVRDGAARLTEDQILGSLKAQGIADLSSLVRATVDHLGAIGGRADLDPWEVFCGTTYVYRRGPGPHLNGGQLQEVEGSFANVERVVNAAGSGR